MMPVNCSFCAACCSLAVPLSKQEIRRISTTYSPNYFLAKDQTLKMVNNYCIFLEIKEGRGFCRIYADRPKHCRDYPGKQFCTLVKKFEIDKLTR